MEVEEGAEDAAGFERWFFLMEAVVGGKALATRRDRAAPIVAMYLQGNVRFLDG